MTFNPSPPPAEPPAPLPVEAAPAAPLPAGAGPAATLYRQDEFVRRPTSWTRPMQLAVGAYLLISTVITFGTQLVFAGDVKAIAATQVAKSFKQAGRTYTQADVDNAVNLGITVGLVFGVIIAVLFVALAILSVTGVRTWVFWVDFVLLALGVFGAISAVNSLTDPANAQIPSGMRPISLVTSLVDIGLVVWMCAGLIKYGPWAQEKVPAAL